SVGWGPWDAGMVTPARRERFQSLGVPLIPVAAGARAFAAELAGSPGTPGDVQVVVLPPGSAGSLDGSTPQADAEVQVSARSHPYLADHDLAGVPVVPVALALEWFVSAARAGGTGPAPVLLRDLTVLRTLALDRFSDGGHRLVVRSRHDRAGVGVGVGVGVGQILELLGDGGTLHYRAVVGGAVVGEAVVGGAAAPAGDRAWPSATDLPPARRPVVYDGHTLFHGARFRSIVDLAGLSPDGATATLCGGGDLGWADSGRGGAGWHTDPAAVDGA